MPLMFENYQWVYLYWKHEIHLKYWSIGQACAHHPFDREYRTGSYIGFTKKYHSNMAASMGGVEKTCVLLPNF